MLCRLLEHANELQQSQADTALGTLAFKKQQAEGRDSRRQVKQLSTELQDGLLSGLVLMIVALLFCGVKCGYLGKKLNRFVPLPPSEAHFRGHAW